MVQNIDIYEITKAGKPYICIEHAQWNKEARTGLRWTNFAGRPDDYGNTSKNFKVQIPESAVEFFKNEGVNVGEWIPANDPTALPVYTIKVYISYAHPDWYPTDVYVEEGSNEVYYNENMLHMLDDKDFGDVALMLRKKPSNRKKGSYTLYLAFAKFFEIINPFEMKYRTSMPDTGMDATPVENDVDEAVPFN